MKIFFLLSLIITYLSGCASTYGKVDGGIYPPVKINQKSGETATNPCYSIREVAVTKNKNILVGFGLH